MSRFFIVFSYPFCLVFGGNEADFDNGIVFLLFSVADFKLFNIKIIFIILLKKKFLF